ncbi:hypothetical protein [Nitrosomonas oligotropha]|uniref:Uncharacterized protein n=1 Tax=Nitrosomonas oligotropha TaxID=42354 RepID=A0A1H8VJ15_9PROT|nr:hypothetical protein [Nitrosomonas oligotropha]SDX60750.1 hypothetical protein SAMN05216300_1603 [Nitrosomonas oligotropha]SEP15371.1 hypothetical protein SAMN05216333_1603 [Nitrosomonas oligotropha]
MCEYCYESAMLYFVASGRRHGIYSRFAYLEEADDLKTEIEQLEDPNNPEPLIDLAFCRLYDHYLTYGFDAGLFNTLQNKFGQEAMQAYLAKRQACHNDLFRAELSRIKLLTNAAQWGRFMADQERMHNHALELLNSYYDWWVLGIGKEKEKRKPNSIDENLLFPDELMTASAEWDKFHALYPALFFSLSYLINHHCDSDIIRKIALTNLKDGADIWTKDLWLQRRAMINCVKRDGYSLIVDNLSQIRYELIYYVLLKVTINLAELSVLKATILSEQSDRLTGTVEREYIFELMDQLAA